MLEQGGIIKISFNPTVGHEQQGLRPALIVSNDIFNFYSNLVMVCPITKHNKNRMFDVKLDDRTKTYGVILVDHARLIDVNTRGYEFIEKIPNDILMEVLDMIGDIVKKINPDDLKKWKNSLAVK